MNTAISNRYRIYLSSFMMDFVYAFAVGAVAVYAVELGATPMQLGLIGTLAAFLYVLASYFGGKLADRMSRKRIILWSVLAAAFSCLGLAGATTLNEIFIYYGLFNLANGFFWPNSQSLLADSRHRKNLAATLGNFCISWSLGFSAGHIVCGYLTEISSVLPFRYSVIITLAILCIDATLSDSEGDQRMGSADFLSRFNPADRELWRRFLICGWLANFSTVFILGAAKMLFPKLALDVDNIDKSMIGILLALIHAGQVTTFIVTKYWHGWQYNRKLYLAIQLLALPGTALLVITGNTACYTAGMFLIGCSGGFTYTASIYYSTSRPPGSANRTGIHEAFVGLGVLLGPLCGGAVAGVWDLHAPYLLSLFLLITVIAVQSLLLYRRQEGS